MPPAFNSSSAIAFMNNAGRARRPFLFVLSYDLSKNYLVPLDEMNPETIRYNFTPWEAAGIPSVTSSAPPFKGKLTPQKIPFETYRKAFRHVLENLRAGNSFLTNLTLSTPVLCTASLEEVFEQAQAPYKLWIKGEFTCFSPETFVKVSETGQISTFPMKGTGSADQENAEEQLRSNRKELYEHTTIVDLLRNDLSRVADQVRVERFRYLNKIRKADGKEILQMSSEIRGQLPAEWKDTLGTWFFELLPAGSICGAPKVKTLEIIREAEKELHTGKGRGFYSGVCGVFDGKTLNSAVMIRFLEETEQGPVFKSGGGITHLSDVCQEYAEVYQKIYVPAG